MFIHKTHLLDHIKNKAYVAQILNLKQTESIGEMNKLARSLTTRVLIYYKFFNL